MNTAGFTNARLNTQFDGILYANSVVMPAAEGDLSSIPAPDRSPLFVMANTNAIASVTFTSQGAIANATAYVVLQVEIGGNDIWYDAVWCNLASVPGAGQSVNYLLATGQFGPAAFQQRTVGNAPTPANSYNTIGLGGRIRFVGKASVNVPGPSSSSGSSGSGSTGIICRIFVKMQGAR